MILPRYWFLVEVFSSDNPPAQAVRLVEQGGLVGFRFLDGDRETAVLLNPTDQAIETNLPLADAGTSWSIYEDHGADGRGKAKPAPVGGRVRLEPCRHVGLVAARSQ